MKIPNNKTVRFIRRLHCKILIITNYPREKSYDSLAFENSNCISCHNLDIDFELIVVTTTR